MVTDEEISEAIQTLFQDPASASNPNIFCTLNGVVQQLESKLGLDLSHKVDFIRAQIHFLFRSHPQQPPPPPPQKDHLALQENPNFPPNLSPASSAFQTFPSQPPPVVKSDASVAVSVSGSEPKESSQPKAKRRGGPGGLNKLCGVSPELQAIVGQPEMPRTEIVKQLWAYIRKNNLQDPSNKRKIICNDELRLVFETDNTDMFKMNKLLAKHIIPLEPTKSSSSKKPRVGAAPVMKNADSGPSPSVIISEALAKFFGVDGREMLQSEVLRRIWEYIRVNHLEDPLNPMAVQCDTKLQELFGSGSISALGIPEVLARHHIFRRS